MCVCIRVYIRNTVRLASACRLIIRSRARFLRVSGSLCVYVYGCERDKGREVVASVRGVRYRSPRALFGVMGIGVYMLLVMRYAYVWMWSVLR